MRRAALVVLFAALLPAGARAQVPTIDVQGTCRIAASVMVRLMASSEGNDTEICLGSEQRARDQMVQDWSTYSAQDRGRCLRTRVYLPSYVEMITCLEMERDARKINIDAPLLDPSGTMRLPRVRPGLLW